MDWIGREFEAERYDVILSIFWYLVDTNTVANLAPIETKINSTDGIIKSEINLKSINAPTDTKNNAAKVSLTGADKADETELFYYLLC